MSCLEKRQEKKRRLKLEKTRPQLNQYVLAFFSVEKNLFHFGCQPSLCSR